jgi:uncharacterized Ntn-hydrolase superfamily protein
MIWSLIARDKETGELGIAVSSSFFAAGAHVPFVAPNIGAIAIQALVNPYHGIDGLQLLREGNAADQLLEILLQGDTGRDIGRHMSWMPQAGLRLIPAPLARTGRATVSVTPSP